MGQPEIPDPLRPGPGSSDETAVLPRIPAQSPRTTRPVGRDRRDAMERVRAAGMTWAVDVARAMDEVRPTDLGEKDGHRRPGQLSSPAARWRGRSVLLAVLGVVLVILLLAVLGWLFYGRRPAPATPVPVGSTVPVTTGPASDGTGLGAAVPGPSGTPGPSSGTPSASSGPGGAGAGRTTSPAKTPTRGGTAPAAGGQGRSTSPPLSASSTSVPGPGPSS